MPALKQTLLAWQFILPGVISVAFVTLILSVVIFVLAYRRNGYARRRIVVEGMKGASLSFSVGLVAWVDDYITGLSRDPIAGEVVPAVLGSFGTLAGFASLRFNLIIPVFMLLVSFSISLFVGTTTGAEIRERHNLADQGLPNLEYLMQEADKEAMIKKHRKILKLPWPPEEISGTNRKTKAQ